MGLETELYKHLRDNPGVSAVVSNRIYPSQAPTSAVLPYVTYTRIADVPDRHLLGPSGLSRATIQIDCWGATNSQNAAVSEAIRLALDGRRDELGEVDVRSIILENETESVEAPDDSSQDATFRTRMDFDFWYRRSIPSFA